MLSGCGGSLTVSRVNSAQRKPNNVWVFWHPSNDGWKIRTSESDPASRPLLTVTYKAPVNTTASQGTGVTVAVIDSGMLQDGGGSDRIIRIMAKVMQQRKDMTVPISIVNKPGGGGSVAYAYLNQHPNDGHFVVLGSKAILTNNIAGRGPSYGEFTPVAHLFGEYVSVTVKPDSPLKTGPERRRS